MAFTLPLFVNDANIWHDGTATSDPPDLTIDCQLYLNTRGLIDIDERNDAEWMPPVWLRCPILTDLRRLDTVECPAGSGRWYHVRWVEIAHLGFPNQYTVGLCHQIDAPAPPPPGGGTVLLEGGDDVLMETTGVILLE